MRLRPAPASPVGPGWVEPRRAQRWTVIGNLDSVHRGQVDPAGLVSVAGASWSLDWWVGAEDRWHLPCREVAVRQSLIGASPVVETRLRVPSGDAVQRAYAARALDGSEALVVEVTNESKVPFAIALAVRPHTQAGTGRIDAVALDGSMLHVNGVPAVVLPKSPGRVALSTGAEGDAAEAVFAGEAMPARDTAAETTCPSGLATAVLLFPLAHTATLRIVVPLGDGDPELAPETLPAAAQVAAGWSSHTASGARLEVPDRRLRDAVLASTRHLLLASGDPEVAEALDLLGFPAEAGRLLTRDPIGLARSEAPWTGVRAVARHWALTRDSLFAEAMVPTLATLLERAARAGRLSRDDRDAAAALLEAAGQPTAAADVRALPPAGERQSDHDGAPTLEELLGSASSTWTWAREGDGHHAGANAALVVQARQRLVREHAGGLSLCPDVPPSWLGQGWELHDGPTRHGRLSYAVRWHGERPALLWQLEPHEPGVSPTLDAPGLDPTWSSTELQGEALLSPVPVPTRAPSRGLRIPVSIEPPRARP